MAEESAARDAVDAKAPAKEKLLEEKAFAVREAADAKALAKAEAKANNKARLEEKALVARKAAEAKAIAKGKLLEEKALAARDVAEAKAIAKAEAKSKMAESKAEEKARLEEKALAAREVAEAKALAKKTLLEKKTLATREAAKAKALAKEKLLEEKTLAAREAAEAKALAKAEAKAAARAKLVEAKAKEKARMEQKALAAREVNQPQPRTPHGPPQKARCMLNATEIKHSPPPPADWPVSTALTRDFGTYAMHDPYIIDLTNVSVMPWGAMGRGFVSLHGPADWPTRQAMINVKCRMGKEHHRTSWGPSVPELALHWGRHDNLPAEAYTGACSKEHAFFIAPWKWENAWHFLNDMVSLTRHVITTPGCGDAPRGAPRDVLCPGFTGPRALYVFEDEHGPDLSTGLPRARVPLVDAVVRALFGERVYPARRLLGRWRPNILGGPEGGSTTAGPRCVQGFHWGIAPRILGPSVWKPAPDERREAAAALRRAVLRYCRVPDPDDDEPPPPPKSRRKAHKGSGEADAAAAAPIPPRKLTRGVFVKRACEGPASAGETRHSCYNAEAERVMHKAFRDAGVALEPCCKWEDPCGVARAFASAEVVVGLHGAGLANALFARRGHILIELKGRYRHENDYFRKIAQARHGGYIAATTSAAGYAGKGLALSPKNTEAVVQCALTLAAREPTRPGCPKTPGADKVGNEGIEGAAHVGHDTDCQPAQRAFKYTCKEPFYEDIPGAAASTAARQPEETQASVSE